MPQILIRDVAPDTLERLKERARRNGRSLQAHLIGILEREAQFTWEEAVERADQIRTRLGPRPHLDSAALIREDRER